MRRQSMRVDCKWSTARPEAHPPCFKGGKSITRASHLPLPFPWFPEPVSEVTILAVRESYEPGSYNPPAHVAKMRQPVEKHPGWRFRDPLRPTAGRFRGILLGNSRHADPSCSLLTASRRFHKVSEYPKEPRGAGNILSRGCGASGRLRGSAGGDARRVRVPCTKMGGSRSPPGRPTAVRNAGRLEDETPARGSVRRTVVRRVGAACRDRHGPGGVAGGCAAPGDLAPHGARSAGDRSGSPRTPTSPDCRPTLTAGRYLVTLDNRTTDQEVEPYFAVLPATVTPDQGAR